MLDDDGEDLVLEVEPPGAEEGADALALDAAVAPGDDVVDVTRSRSRSTTRR